MPLIRDLNNKWDKVFENGQKKQKKNCGRQPLKNMVYLMVYLWSSTYGLL